MKLRRLAVLSLIMGFTPFVITSCKNTHLSKPKCLAVGSARSVMIKESSEFPGQYKVTVKGSNPITVLLTQRPQRNSKKIETEAFLEDWKRSYRKSAPNVSFTSVHSNRTTTNILVLSNPNYNAKTSTITFDAVALEPEKEEVKTGIFNNVTITYDSQVQSMIYDSDPID